MHILKKKFKKDWVYLQKSFKHGFNSPPPPDLAFQLFIVQWNRRHFRKMEEVLNGCVTNPNPTPTLTPNPNCNLTLTLTELIKKIQKETTLENR